MKHQPADAETLVKEVKFQLKKYAIEHSIPQDNLAVDSFFFHDVPRWTLRIVRQIAFIQSDGRLYISTPASWWQHLKKDFYSWKHCPRWIAGRWPVRYNVDTYKAEAMFPQLPIPANKPEFEVGFFQWAEKESHDTPGYTV